MTTIVIVPPQLPAALDEGRFAQNGDLPTQSVLRRVARGQNYVASNARKLLHLGAFDTQSTPAMPSAGATGTVCHCFRTGENVHSVAMLVGLAPASSTSGTSQAYVQGTLTHSGGSIAGPELHYHTVQAGTYAPGEVAWVWGEITTDDGLAANTQYRMDFAQHIYARIHSVMVYETAKSSLRASVDGVSDPLYHEATKPIYSQGIEDIATTSTLLHKHNGAQLLSFSRQIASTAPTPNSTTWENVNDSSVSAFASTAPGYHLATQYHDTLMRDIPVELGVYATRTAGSGTLEVKLEQSGGALLTRTGISAASSPFDSSTHTIAAETAPEKTDVMVRCSDNSTTWRIDAIGLWEYAA